MKIDPIKIKTLLMKRGLKQWQLAEKLGIYETSLTKIIYGRQRMDRSLLKKMCYALKVPKREIVKND